MNECNQCTPRIHDTDYVTRKAATPFLTKTATLPIASVDHPTPAVGSCPFEITLKHDQHIYIKNEANILNQRKRSLHNALQYPYTTQIYNSQNT
jgi:hypothetical protein